jgi:hypothetical protein
MPTEHDELSARIQGLSDDDLVRMVTIDSENYRPEALSYAQAEVARRNLGSMEKRVEQIHQQEDLAAHPPLVAPDPTQLPAIWPGLVLTGVCVAVLLAVKLRMIAIHSTAIFYALTILLCLCWILWFWIVYRTHAVLRRVTNNAYRFGAVESVVFHFIPLFNVYWTYRWPNEIGKFVNSRRIGPQIVGVVPGLVMCLALFLVFFIWPPYGLVTAFGVVAFLNHWIAEVLRAESGVKADESA